jgi:hypothetical protein
MSLIDKENSTKNWAYYKEIFWQNHDLGTKIGIAVHFSNFAAIAFPLGKAPMLNRVTEVGLCHIIQHFYISPIPTSNFNKVLSTNLIYRGDLQVFKYFPNLWAQNTVKSTASNLELPKKAVTITRSFSKTIIYSSSQLVALLSPKKTESTSFSEKTPPDSHSFDYSHSFITPERDKPPSPPKLAIKPPQPLTILLEKDSMDIENLEDSFIKQTTMPFLTVTEGSVIGMVDSEQSLVDQTTTTLTVADDRAIDKINSENALVDQTTTTLTVADDRAIDKINSENALIEDIISSTTEHLTNNFLAPFIGMTVFFSIGETESKIITPKYKLYYASTGGIIISGLTYYKFSTPNRIIDQKSGALYLTTKDTLAAGVGLFGSFFIKDIAEIILPKEIKTSHALIMYFTYFSFKLSYSNPYIAASCLIIDALLIKKDTKNFLLGEDDSLTLNDVAEIATMIYPPKVADIFKIEAFAMAKACAVTAITFIADNSDSIYHTPLIKQVCDTVDSVLPDGKTIEYYTEKLQKTLCSVPFVGDICRAVGVKEDLIIDSYSIEEYIYSNLSKVYNDTLIIDEIY